MCVPKTRVMVVTDRRRRASSAFHSSYHLANEISLRHNPVRTYSKIRRWRCRRKSPARFRNYKTEKRSKASPADRDSRREVYALMIMADCQEYSLICSCHVLLASRCWDVLVMYLLRSEVGMGSSFGYHQMVPFAGVLCMHFILLSASCMILPAGLRPL